MAKQTKDFDVRCAAFILDANRYLGWLSEETTRVRRIVEAASGPTAPNPSESEPIRRLTPAPRRGKRAVWPRRIDEVLKQRNGQEATVQQIAEVLLQGFPRAKKVVNLDGQVRSTLGREAKNYGWLARREGRRTYWRKEVQAAPSN